jgi:hypothetical protein
MHLVGFQKKENPARLLALHRKRMSGVSSNSRRIVLSYQATMLPGDVSHKETGIEPPHSPTPAVGEARSDI